MRTLSCSRLLRALTLATAVAVVTAAFTVTSHASDANTLTFSHDVALPGVVLPAGTYVFDIANPDTSADVVRVRRNGRVHYMGFTLTMQRPANMPADRPVSLGEPGSDTPAPIKAWFPLGSSRGHQFMYR